MKHVLVISLLCSLALINAACDTYDDTYPKVYHKIVSLKQTGETEVSLYTTGEDASFPVTVMKTGYDPSLMAKATLTVLNEDKLKEYNEAYTALPSNTYELKGASVDFQSSEQYKVVDVVLKTELIQNLMQANAGKNYVLPLSLQSTTDSVNSLNQLYIMKPVIVIPKVAFQVSSTDCVKGYENKTEPLRFTIPLGMEITNQWSFTAKVEMVDKSGIGGYISQNSVTLENNGVVQFSPGKVAELNFTVKAPGADLTNFLLGGKLILKIKTLEGISFDVDETELTVTVTGKKYPLTAGMFSFMPALLSGSAANLLDDDPATIAQFPYPGSMGQYIQISLPEAITDFALSHTNKSVYDASFLRGYDLKVSSDGVTYKTLKTYTPNDMGGDDYIKTPASSFVTEVHHVDDAIKYIRVVQSTNNFNNKPNFILGELRLFAE